jgi:hypothetical protein
MVIVVDILESKENKAKSFEQQICMEQCESAWEVSARESTLKGLMQSSNTH